MSSELKKTNNGRWTNNKRSGGRKNQTDGVGFTRNNWYDKKKNAKKIQRRKEQVGEKDPHFGLEAITASNFALDTLARFAGVDVPDIIVREIEGAILLLTNLSQQTTTLGVTSAIGLHLRAYSKTSISKVVMEYVQELFPKEEQAGTEGAFSAPDWLSCMRGIRQNWQLCKNNKAFNQISKLLGILVVLGLCRASDLEFSIGKFKVFTPNLFERHMSAFDLADALFETVLFFAEGMYLCFKTGSLKPLLLNDHSALELDEEFVRVSAWWDLVKVGNLSKLEGMSDQEFERRMNDLSTNLKNLSMSLKGLDKKLVMDKFSKVLVMQNDFVTAKIACGVRHAPFAIELFGESSQGKTTLGDQLLDALLVSQDMPVDKRFRATFNPSDKYMSNWKSDMLVLLFDDCSNEKAQFVERPPTRAIIDVINNQMYYANKAELDAKGKCFVEPWLVMATTNKKDLDAGCYSNCPYSIQRRLVCFTVRAKKEFQRKVDGVYCGIDSAKVREFYTGEDGVEIDRPFDDIWEVDIEYAKKPQKLSTVAKYAPVIWDGREMRNIDMATAIQWSIEQFDEHKKNQQSILDNMKRRNDGLRRCSHEGCKHIAGNCPYHKQEQFGRETLKSVHTLFKGAKTMMFPNVVKWENQLDARAAQLIYKQGTKFLKSWDWIKVIPAPLFDNEHAMDVVRWAYQDRLTSDYRQRTCALWTISIGACVSCLLLGKYGFIPMFFILWQAAGAQNRIVEQAEDELFEKLRNNNANVRDIVKRYRDEHVKWICGTFFGIAAVYGLAKAYRAYKQYDSHGSLEPKTREEVAARDAEANEWCQVVRRELPITSSSKCTTTDTLMSSISKNLVYGSIHIEGEDNGMLNALFLNSNVVLVPNHYFNEFGDNLRCTFRKKNPEACGGKFAADISKAASVLVPQTDFRICYCATGGSFGNILKHFPIGNMPSVPFRLQWRKKDGEMLYAKGISQPCTTSTYMEFVGGEYENLTMNTFKGLCGAVIVSETVGAVVLGCHLGGTGGTTEGCYGSLVQSQIITAIGELRNIEGVVLSGSAGVFETQVMGMKITKAEDLHDKSPVNFMPKNSQVEYLGACVGRTTQKSDVRVTPISADLVEICNSPNVYCAPVFHPEWFGYQACLSNLAVPAHPYPHDLLMTAIRDYKEPLIPIFRSELWNGIKPLTDQENINGIPGLRFVDAIKLNTSAGIPLKGKKRNYIIEVTDDKGEVFWREFDPKIMEEIERCLNLYRNGERAYCIAKACKKDEILTKKKCRIFYGNSTTLTYLIRKYFLPILRVLQMNPKVSECAVGINAYGPEWEEFHQHATKFGMDRLFGGDYGKYDQKLPSQLIFAALRILIDFAKECPAYNEEDIRVMEAMTGDIVFAYIAFNGDLIGLTEGTHISGNSLTVIINGICGSLNLRCFYYTQHPCDGFSSRRKFRDYVAAITYGDDNIGSVHPDEDKFTIKGISEFLAAYGQVYTMPDKESELLNFLPAEEFEFLKRTSVYIPELEQHVGALLEKSIFKSLHCFMRPKGCVMTELEAVAVNVDHNLGEWFNHGEKVYEQRRIEMNAIAEKNGFTHMCRTLDMTYADRIQKWNDKYGKQYRLFAKPNLEFTEELEL